MDIKDVKCELCEQGVEHDVLVMSSRCHIGSPTYEVLSNDRLTVYCATCDKKVVAFKVEVAPDFKYGENLLDDTGTLLANCHPEAETFVMLHKDQRLVVQCSACDKEIATFKVVEFWKDK